jgi:virulence-associated protein VagC
MELRERLPIEVRFAKVSKPYILLWRNKLVVIYPLSKREDHLEITAKLVRLRDLLWAQEPEKN